MRNKHIIIAHILGAALAAVSARADLNLTVGNVSFGPNFTGPCWNTVVTNANINTSFSVGGGNATLSSFVLWLPDQLEGVTRYFYFYVLDLHNVPGTTNHCVNTLTHFATPLTCQSGGSPVQVFSVQNWNWPDGYQVVFATSATLGTHQGAIGDLTVQFSTGCLSAGATANPYGMLSELQPMTNVVEVIDDYTDPSTGLTTETTYNVRAIVPCFAPLWYTGWQPANNGVAVSPPGFTFQGSLTGSNGAPVPDGFYDFVSQLVDSADPSVALNIGPPVTNSQVAVSKGLFTLERPTDPCLFSDIPLWLSFSVTPSGAQPSDPIAVLWPPNHISPTPRASYATAAGVVTALAPNQAVLSLNGLTGDAYLFPGQGVQMSGIIETNGLHGIQISAGISSSDRNVKTNVAPIKPEEILAKLAELPIRSWRYTNEPADIHHLGPMAQDFKATFELGNDDRTIAFVDAGGVALAAIQGLNQKLDEKNSELKELKQQNNEMARQLSELQATVKSLVENQ